MQYIPEIKRTIKFFSTLCSEHFEKKLKSIIIYGGLTMDDFCPGWSDIDFVVVLDAKITKPIIEKIKLIHQQLLIPEYKYGKIVEGFYVPVNYFLQKYGPNDIAYFAGGGHKPTYRRLPSLIEYLSIIQTGKTIYGEKLIVQIAPPTKQELIIESLQNIESCLAKERFPFQPLLLKDTKYTPELASHALISCCLWLPRIIYTLKMNKIVSKTYAGEYFAQKYPGKWSEFILRAVQIRKTDSKLTFQEVKDLSLKFPYYFEYVSNLIFNLLDKEHKSLKIIQKPNGKIDYTAIQRFCNQLIKRLGMNV